MGLNKSEKKLASVIKEITANAARSKDDGVKNAFKILDRTRKDVIAAVNDASSAGQITRLKQLDRAVDRATLEFGTKYKSELAGDMDDLWGLGQTLVDNPLDVMGVSARVPELNVRALESAQNAMIRLVDKKRQGIVAGLNKGIKQAVESGIVGLKTPFEVMQDIGRNLTDPGPFKSTTARAETIFRTETATIQNTATSSRLDQSAKHIPGLGHQFWWSGIGRIDHAIANGQVRLVGVPFDVGGYKMMHPLDSSLGAPASQIINCGCSESAHMPDWPSMAELNPALVKKADRFTQPIAESVATDGAADTLYPVYNHLCGGALLIHRMAARPIM